MKRTSNQNSDPLFGDSLRLSSESPAIDAGINNAWGPIGQNSNKDYEGNERIQDGDGNGSDIVDIGAIEFPGGTPIRHSILREQRIRPQFGQKSFMFSLNGR